MNTKGHKLLGHFHRPSRRSPDCELLSVSLVTRNPSGIRVDSCPFVVPYCIVSAKGTGRLFR